MLTDTLRDRLIRVAREGSFRYADIVDRILAELERANQSELALLRELEATVRGWSAPEHGSEDARHLLAKLDALRAKAGA